MKKAKKSEPEKKKKRKKATSVFEETSLPIDYKYVPGNEIANKDKCAWTEKRLQTLKRELFSTFKKCKRECEHCKTFQSGDNQKCHYIVHEMEKYLVPYGLSIFKRSFKFRATCEEMDRVVTEAIGALLMDVWHKQKNIHSSFGKLLFWKILYHLDGKTTLFNEGRVTSLDAMTAEFTTSSHDSNPEDVIESLSETLHETSQHDYVDTYRKDAMRSVIGILESTYDNFHKFTTKNEKMRIYIKCLYAFNRFIQNRPTDVIFDNDGKAKVYYEQMLDAVKTYLKKYAAISHT